ncbi:MAG: MFS transporter [Gemmatimonadaceae bacterium]|nr:MFS transporter [Gemmatimonadaceae bacterium]
MSHPSLFGILYFPYGLMVGVPAVMLGWLATRAGLPVSAAATIVGTAFAPAAFKFLWAPIGDLTLTRKRWYVLANAVCAAVFFGMCTIPMSAATLPLITTLVLIGAVAATFIAFALQGLLLHNCDPSQIGRAAGFYQTGNMMGQTLGGGAALYLVRHSPTPAVGGAVLAAAVLACNLPLLALREPPRVGTGTLGARAREVWSELRTMLSQRDGRLALLLAFLPIGTGNAQFLFSAVASEWKASADFVSLVLGLVAGIAIALGTLGGGWFTDRVPHRRAYALACAAQGVLALVLLFSPREPWAFAVLTACYTATLGSCVAAITGMSLALAKGGAASTKVSLFLGVNTLGALGLVKGAGWAHDLWGTPGMLGTEVVTVALALVVFAVISRRVLT